MSINQPQHQMLLKQLPLIYETESGRIVATLIRLRDFDRAEEAAQQRFAAATLN